MKQQNVQRPLRIGLLSLGCAKNLVDAEVMLGTLLKDGIELTNDATQADVVVINTCSFIDSAQEESVDTILESCELRDAQNRGQGVVVAVTFAEEGQDARKKAELGLGPPLLPEENGGQI